MNLADVSRTAILTLVAHVAASENRHIDFSDPMAIVCLERLMAAASPQERKWIIRQKWLIATPDARAMARRVKAFDSIAEAFIASHPDCTVINLGCGFDTRFWRIKNQGCRYVEIDLPEVIALKRQLIREQPAFELIGCSVLEPEWLDQVMPAGNSNFLLLAEGLFMFLPENELKALFQRLAGRLVRSQLVVEMADKKFTHGFWKMALGLQARVWGLEVAFASGIKHPSELEAYGQGLRVLESVKGSSVGPIIRVAINAG